MNKSYLRAREEIRGSIMSKIDFSREVPDSEVLDLIDRHLTLSGSEPLLLTLEEKKRLRHDATVSFLLLRDVYLYSFTTLEACGPRSLCVMSN